MTGMLIIFCVYICYYAHDEKKAREIYIIGSFDKMYIVILKLW